jgi:hypothetical protein
LLRPAKEKTFAPAETRKGNQNSALFVVVPFVRHGNAQPLSFRIFALAANETPFPEKPCTGDFSVQIVGK